MLIAVVFSLALFVWTNTRPRIELLGRVRGERGSRCSTYQHRCPIARGRTRDAGTTSYQELGWRNVVAVPGVRIVKFMAPLFFANCSALKASVCVYA